ncbi:uncharacterized protein CEXT_53141 [Caerostris extrusa]|uniref:Homeobox domain-containing protein n=1 Tax=Caerostris extrusa TaxID=172846 RepID=A0AAV4Y220_CAEEX|nr:uncharacterized protein CEXT_53141 [Caerostris extrusa]
MIEFHNSLILVNTKKRHYRKSEIAQLIKLVLLNVNFRSRLVLKSSVLQALTKGRLECDIPDETRKKFDQWYLQQFFQHCRQVALLQQQHQQQQQQQQQQQHLHHHHPHHPAIVPPGETITGRTRIRTSFDPELELPKLHRWFAENQHPSRLQIQQYVRELNSLESRRGRKPLDVNNVVYWFKNARAAHKKGLSRSVALRVTGFVALAVTAGRKSVAGVRTEWLARRASDRAEDQRRTKRLSSEHSIESSDSGDEEVDVMEDISMTIDEPGIREDYGETMQQNGGVSGNDSLVSQEGEADRQGSGNYPGRVLGRLEERRKRNRTFIDPVSEVPRLEQWFSANTHPSHSQIVRFTQELNSMQYRQKFPKLEPKNIQFWFKNRRAKCKRLNLAANLQNISCTDKNDVTS